MNATTTDLHAAWVLAPRDEELPSSREHYAAKFPPPPADCSIHHNAFGAGCPWCGPRNAPMSRAAARTPIVAGRRATTTNGATS